MESEINTENLEKKKKTLYDIVGGFGTWQKQILIFFFLSNIIANWYGFAIVFMTPNVDYRCVSSAITEENATAYVLLNSTKCDMTYAEIGYENTHVRTVPCTAWEYDTNEFTDTIISEWNLVCDREWLISFSKSIYMLGCVLSSFVFGQISDNYGRYKVCVINSVISCALALVLIFSNSIFMYNLLRFIAAACRTGIIVASLVLLVEITAPQKRALAVALYQSGWSVGILTAPLFAYPFRSWYWMQVTIALAHIPQVFIFWVVSESPRWLLTRNKRKKLSQVLSAAAIKNGKQAKEEDIASFIQSGYKEEKKVQKSSKPLMDLLKHSVYRKRTFYMIVIWLVNAFVYYAFMLNTNDLGGNPYFAFFISGLMELPADAITFFVARKLGRKPFLRVSMVATGAAFGAILAVPQNMFWLMLTFAVIGKFFVTVTLRLLYLYTPELFPTVVRNVAVGICSSSGKFGSSIAPFTRELDRVAHFSVSYAIYAGLAISTSFFAFLLPETKNQDITDTLQESDAKKPHQVTDNKLEGNC